MRSTCADLAGHRRINIRHGSDDEYLREFDKRNRSLSVSVNGLLIVDDVDVMIRAALGGVGLAFVS
jgi:hypothetical protein